MKATLAAVLALSGIAHADLAPPPRAAAHAARAKVFVVRDPIVVEDELKTREPTVEPRRDPPAATTNANATATANAAAKNSATPNSATPNSATPAPESPAVVEREYAGPEQPLDFVDATLETPDLAARFVSSRPVWKRVPATFARKRGAAK